MKPNLIRICSDGLGGDMAPRHGRMQNCLTMACLIATGALLALGGCAQPGEVQFTESDAAVVDVMTFNIRNGKARDGVNNWPKRRDLVVGVLSDFGGDILGLQEAFDFQVQYIAKKLPRYDVYWVGRDDANQAGESCAILYRRDRYTLADSGTFWFSDTPARPSTHWGNRWLRICSWVRLTRKAGGGGFYVYNLHLDHLSQNSRERSAKLLAERISQRKVRAPFIVMGDFNMATANPGMKYLMNVGGQTPYPRLVSVWEVVHPDGPPRKTAHGFKGAKEGRAIDHILVEKGTTVLEADIDQGKIDGRYPSDHYPVTARIKLPKAADR